MKVKIKSLIISLVVFAAVLVPVTSVSADDATTDAAKNKACGSSAFFPKWYDNGLCDPATGGVVSPGSFAPNDTAKSFGIWAGLLAMNLVTILLTVVGYTSLGFIIFGGFKYMTNGDNSGGQASARTTITNAVIGLVISIVSVALVKFIAGAIA